MKEVISNNKFELDKDNIEFNNAAEFVRHTDKLIYLTGKAGTGKTTFLKYIKDTTDKKTVIVAPTGVAAINAGGVTINSFFQIAPGPFVPNDSRLRTKVLPGDTEGSIYSTFKYSPDKLRIIQNMELLIIDEISMVRADTLDVIDRLLKVFRRKPYLPFGGVQVILIGDTFQLPPIANDNQWNILSEFYKTKFFFSSKVIEDNTPLYIELKKIYRQSEQEFIDLLNRVRISEVTPNDLISLNSKYNPSFTGNGKDYIILATHNIIVDETNLSKLNELKTKEFIYEAATTGKFPNRNKPTDHNLKLKEGAQVMFVKNDSGNPKKYYNGKIGKIKELSDETIVVVFDDESEVKVGKEIWENIEYTYDKKKKEIVEEVIGTFEQYPIRLAWAITVHKSQGLTFEKVIADLGASFTSGQVYVALSRCTSYNGLVLKTKLNRAAIKTDHRVIEFAKNETPGTLITKQLETGRADFYYKKTREKVSKGDMKQAFTFFKKALKYRNDIETDLFKRYIEVQGERFLSIKGKYDILLEKYFGLKDGLDEKVKLSSDDSKIKDKKIEEQELEIELLNKKIYNLEIEKDQSDKFSKSKTYFEKGLSKERTGDYDEAINYYTKSIELNTRYALAYFNRANIKLEQGKNESALKDFNTVIEIDSNFVNAYCNRATIKINLGDSLGAIDDLTKAINIDPKIASAYYNRGLAQNDLGNSLEASKDFSKCIELDSENVDAYINRGVMRISNGLIDEAIEDYSMAIQIDPQCAIAYKNRCYAKRKTGDTIGSGEDYSMAIKIDPQIDI